MKVFTVTEVAAILRVNYYTVIRMIHRGALPATRLGHSFRITEENFNNFLGTK